MMPDTEQNALERWREKAKENISTNSNILQNIANIKISYNISQGFLDDLMESSQQLMSNEWGWIEFTAAYILFLEKYGIQEDWRPHFNKDVGFKDGNKWRIVEGKLQIPYEIMGIEISYLEHSIIGNEEGCYLLNTIQSNSAVNYKYKMCP